MPNNFLLLTPEEWDTLKLYLDVIGDHLNGAASPVEDVYVGGCQLKFKQLFNKATVFLETDGGKFVMQSPIFEQLRLCVDVVDAAIAESYRTAQRMDRLMQNETGEVSEEDALLLVELQWLVSVVNKDAPVAE